MYRSYLNIDGRLVRTEDVQQSNEALWVDALEPDQADREAILDLYTQSLVPAPELEEIEATARFYEDEHGLHIHSLFLKIDEAQSDTSTVAFTLNNGRLYSLREHDFVPFRLFRMRARSQSGHADCARDILLNLFEIKIEHLADTIEQVYKDLDRASNLVMFQEENQPPKTKKKPKKNQDTYSNLEKTIPELARLEDLSGNVRLCVMDSQRALSYLLRRGKLNEYQADWVRDILKDIESLVQHYGFIFQKIGFLMDASLGLINLQQNRIAKIFSIASVLLLPPTLVTSVFGMNFSHIPYLQNPYGFWAVLILASTSAIAPLFYFKRRGYF